MCSAPESGRDPTCSPRPCAAGPRCSSPSWRCWCCSSGRRCGCSGTPRSRCRSPADAGSARSCPHRRGCIAHIRGSTSSIGVALRPDLARHRRGADAPVQPDPDRRPVQQVAGSTNAAVAGTAVAFGLVLAAMGLTIVQALVAYCDRACRRPPGPDLRGRLCARVRRRIGTIVVALVVVAAVVVALEITVVGIPFSIWLLVRWSLFSQCIVLEDHGLARRPAPQPRRSCAAAGGASPGSSSPWSASPSCSARSSVSRSC